ncbi:helix-turn-helix transcriptional regulator [Pseudomonas veronii]|uniref:helix-turn-helix domain-containing protein n=1 Tax=Pseudomonas veronii TaxID=76761 RepID=UPI0015A43F39|nr:helix-turn-helix transcriptional regulator [Pseudomonas veronii]NWD58919.1 helix-turn-helix transcriptional regulator [Pseudomonas veronii]
MISNHLGMVEALRPASNELAAAVEQFLAAGGHIEEGPACGYIPKPITYSNQMPPAPKPFVRRRVDPVPLPFAPLDVRSDKRAKQAELAKALAPTHTQSQASMALGMTSKTLKGLAKDFGFTFKRSEHGGYNGPECKKQLAERNAKFAERIKEFKEQGITQRQAYGRLGISRKTFERILEEHGIDYPKACLGRPSCAA